MEKYVFKSKIKRIFMFLFDFFGVIFYFPFKFFKKKIIIPKKILVVRLDQIGDMVQVIPFLEELKKKFPTSKIYFLCAKQTEFLLHIIPITIDKILTIENSWFYKEKKINFKEIINIIKMLRKENIDIAYDLRGDLRNILLLYFSGVKNIIGYGCTGGGFLLTEKKKYDRDMHEIDKNLNLIDIQNKNEIYIDFKIQSNIEEKIKNFFKQKGIKEQDKKIIIHPFSRAKSKLWGFKKFSFLSEKIVNEYNNIKIFIVGANNEKIYQNEFNFNNNIINCIGEFKIEETIQLIKSSDIFIGCDSGLQFFSAYLNKKICIIYGFTTNYLRWLPKVKKENIIAFSKPVDCGPCELDECPKDKRHKCMEMITVDEVYESIKKWLK